MTEGFDFASQYFAENYHYDEKDLGAEISGEQTHFKLWAPTATEVSLCLFESGNGGVAYKTVNMQKGECGVWFHCEKCSHGTYYTYLVNASGKTSEIVDPYAKACGVNGERGMVVDLSKTNPDGWERSGLENPIKSYSEAIIWEIHVRDFSNKIAASAFRGKYLAFTETGLTNEHGQPIGIDYLKELGVTHVHLLPVSDFATVDEGAPHENFNWGYDPQNFNIPDGSYSSNPYDGEIRIKELKQAIMSLHAAGIGVILDMVYNHTYLPTSSLECAVPGYYYRYDEHGKNTNRSGCGNDTASERYMFRKFMVDSAGYWVQEYKLDGLRFDLMGLHDVETMQKIEQAVHQINPNAILYGEGWNMCDSFGGIPAANQQNIGKISPSPNAIGGIAVFNDVMRDGLKGSVFSRESRGYINGNAADCLQSVIFGICGGNTEGFSWKSESEAVINYMSAHDNLTLWDKLAASNPCESEYKRYMMNKLGAAIIMISKGTPFFQGGEEMLRTKFGDDNSYRSPDAINNIDWSLLKPGTLQYETMLYYKGLIAMRKHFSIFTDKSTRIAFKKLERSALEVMFTGENGSTALALINPHNEEIIYTLEEEWNLVANADGAGSTVIARESGEVTLEGISARVYVNGSLVIKKE